MQRVYKRTDSRFIIGAIINFVIIALVVFLIVRFMMKEDATQKR